MTDPGKDVDERPAGRRPVHLAVARQAGRTPDAVAVSGADGRSLTYGELTAWAGRAAARLLDLGVRPDTVVGVLLPRGIEAVVAEVAVLRAGGAYLPLDPEHPVDRLEYLCRDSGTTIVVTTGEYAALAPRAARTVMLDSLPASAAAGQPGVRPDNLAYVMYTSGSTGRPKGVMIEHGALANFTGWFREEFDVGVADRFAMVNAPGFDISVIDTWPALTSGGQVHVVDAEIRLSPPSLQRWLLENQVTMMVLTWSLAEPLLDLRWPARTALRVLITGGEPVRRRPDSALPFTVVNGYGPTEGTVLATFGAIEPEAGQAEPPDIGRAVGGTTCHVLDPAQRPAFPGTVGELYLGGAGVARGYLGKPGITAEHFVPDPFAAGPGARLYRTGDLVRARPDGRLDFIGRADAQVKLRGNRVEPGEIEATLCRHPAVARAHVTIRDDGPGGTGRLVAYLTTRESEPVPTPDALREHLEHDLPRIMIPATYVPLERMPLTTNGKVDVAALPPPEPRSDRDHEPPATAIEVGIARMWCELLELPRIGAADNFFDLGGHSLLAERLVTRIRSAYGVELPISAVFAARTLRELAGRVARAPRAARGATPIRPVPRDGHLPLSFSQERVWFLQQLNPTLRSYHAHATLRLTGTLDVAALVRALTEIVRRHEIYRTTFADGSDGPRQVIHPPFEVEVPVTDLRGAADPEASAQDLIREAVAAQIPVDRLPLIRWRLLRLAADRHVLLHTEHHLVHDGWTFNLFVAELCTLYGAYAAGRPAPLPEPELQFADFAAWQRSPSGEKAAEEGLGYWVEALDGVPQVLDLPTGRSRPSEWRFAGDAPRFSVPAGLAERVRDLARGMDATPFMVTLAAFELLLCHWSGLEDFCVASGIAGRRRREIERLFGMVVNTVPLRADLRGDPTFGELIDRVRASVLGAHANQDVPFERVVAAMRPARVPGRHPLCQVCFSFHDAPMTATGMPGLDVVVTPGVANGTAKFDLNIIGIPAGDQVLGRAAPAAIDFIWEYDTDVFEARTVARAAELHRRLLAAVVADPHARVSDLFMGMP